MTTDIKDYLMFKGFNQYGITGEYQKGSLWIRERDGVKMQVFTSTERVSPDSSFLVEISVNKLISPNRPFEANLKISGDFMAGPFTSEEIVNSGILDRLESTVGSLGQ